MNKKLGIAAAIAFVGVVACIIVWSLGAKDVSFGISQRASKFTDVEVTNELQTQTFTNTGSSTISGNLSVSGNAAITGTVSVTGETSLGNLVKGGSVSSISTTSASYSLAATDVCDNNFLTLTSLSPVTTFTAPASSTLFADCLTATGKSVRLTVLSGNATSTVLAIGTGGTLHYSVSSTIAGNDTATVEFIRLSSTTYRMLVTNQPS